MIEFALAVPFRIVQAVVDELELIRFRFDIETRYDANPLDHSFGIIAPLPPKQFYGKRVLLIHDRIVKNIVKNNARPR